ncbi:DUF2835 domain-containing protein [Gilvimarinus algae]|uniref:DUF2835 domain-containing protein n=1 Tax=Gilvimarinus algae TaxID=3058037 RepID=A0ABT8TFB5_9GAMM|nr:DUF2835 domain-containing protein [Gilvimarinus sp. SDUM040014]MDO3382209.1 DUF2835 domain-containing protein [Gilvimarinus sp. SDUM040014]
MAAPNNAVILNLTISAEKLERWYEGSAREVLAYSVDGRKIRFPVSILRPFVTHSGIRGRFQIVFDGDNRFKSIHRID